MRMRIQRMRRQYRTDDKCILYYGYYMHFKCIRNIKTSSPKASSPIEEDELSIPVDKKCPRGYTRNKKTGKCAKNKVKFTLKQTL